MTTRWLVQALVTVVLTSALYAQEQQAPQGGGNQGGNPGGGGAGGGQPGNQPNTPQPQPGRAPNIPTPQPQFPTQEEVVIRGRIITTAPIAMSTIVEVKIETDGGQPVGFAYADSSGEFTFRRAGVSLDQTFYVLVNLEGYKPVKERIFGGFSRGSFDGFLTIFMEREAPSNEKGGGGIVDLKQLRAKIPGKAVDEYEKALKESSKGNKEKAIEGLQKAVKLAPDFYEALHSLGIQFLALQKLDDAEGALVRARDLSPKAAEPLINLGTLYYQRGESQADAGKADDAAAAFEKAADTLEEAIRRNPASPSAHGYLGAALYKMSEYERAETSLKRALELDDQQTNARLMLINVYTRSSRYEEALEQANIFISKNPKAPQRASLESIKAQIEKVIAKQE